MKIIKKGRDATGARIYEVISGDNQVEVVCYDEGYVMADGTIIDHDETPEEVLTDMAGWNDTAAEIIK